MKWQHVATLAIEHFWMPFKFVQVPWLMGKVHIEPTCSPELAGRPCQAPWHLSFEPVRMDDKWVVCIRAWNKRSSVYRPIKNSNAGQYWINEFGRKGLWVPPPLGLSPCQSRFTTPFSQTPPERIPSCDNLDAPKHPSATCAGGHLCCPLALRTPTSPQLRRLAINIQDQRCKFPEQTIWESSPAETCNSK